MTNTWEFVDLRVFCAVVKCGSFTQAAKDMGYSGPYISKRISVLETKLGAKLFNRTTRTMQITAEGLLAHSWAVKILDAASEMSTELANSKVTPSGSLRISTSLRLGRNHVAPILSQLVKDYTSIDVTLELVDRRVDLLQEGIDIDIRAGEVDEPHLVSQRVVSSERILCAAPEYLAANKPPLNLSELGLHECLVFRDGASPLGSWRLTGPKGAETIRVSGNVIRSHHSDVVKNWALDGHGIILLSVWDAAEYLRDGRLLRVLPQYHQPADIWAVTQARFSNTVRMKLCMDYLVSRLKDGPHALDTDLDY